MYIPAFNKFPNQQEAVGFMQAYSFATIVSVTDGLPVATHLPFIIKQEGDKVILSSHFAKANPQANELAGKKVLVIFTEPHAYISPKNYEKELNVPTWNYLAVHAYGTCKILEGEANKAAVLKEMIQSFESDYQQQWDNLPRDYKSKMMNGIIAFEIEVDDLQAKAKLSQNRSTIEQQNIIEYLDKSTDTTEKAIATYMEKLNSK